MAFFLYVGMYRVPKFDGGLAFVMFLSRLAHAQPVQGQMEHKWGWDRTYLTKITLYMRDWLVQRWVHLLSMNVTRVSASSREWSRKIGAKANFPDPCDCLCILFIDGVFM
jgi:hypothetical protein